MSWTKPSHQIEIRHCVHLDASDALVLGLGVGDLWDQYLGQQGNLQKGKFRSHRGSANSGFLSSMIPNINPILVLHRNRSQ